MPRIIVQKNSRVIFSDEVQEVTVDRAVSAIMIVVYPLNKKAILTFTVSGEISKVVFTVPKQFAKGEMQKAIEDAVRGLLEEHKKLVRQRERQQNIAPPTRSRLLRYA